MLPLARNYYHFAVQIGSCWLAYPARCRRHGPMDEARSRPLPDVRKREGNADFPIWTTRKPWRNGWPKAIPETLALARGATSDAYGADLHSDRYLAAGRCLLPA